MGKGKKVEVVNKGPGGFIFLMTYIGAAIYFVQTNEGFWGFVLGLLEAAVWPAYVVYNVLQMLHV